VALRALKGRIVLIKGMAFVLWISELGR
jgi:hypothetical protein